MTRLAYSVSRGKSRLIILIPVSILACTVSSGLAIQSDRTNTYADPEKPGIEIFSASAQEALARMQARRKLVNESKCLYVKGDLDNAERGLRQCLEQYPADLDAQYYLALISQARNNLRHWKEPVTLDPLEKMRRKLDGIRIDSIAFNDLSLNEVMGILAVETKKRDPKRHGINFLWHPMFVSEDPDVPARVNLPFGLTDVSVSDLLDAIVKVANRPITYSVEPYGVLFSPKTDLPPLYVRVFKIEEHVLYAALQVDPPKVLPSPLDHDLGSFQRGAAIVRVFKEIGIDWKRPKAYFYSPSRCDLIVRATEEDLERIEDYLKRLKLAAGQEAQR